MKKLYSIAAIIAGVVAFCTASSLAQITRYVVTNDDHGAGNSATFFKIGAGGALTQSEVVATGGNGLGGGYIASSRVALLRSQGCIYISNAGDLPGTVSGIVESTQTLVGKFAASAGDNGGLGISMALGKGKLYAGFPHSGTIGTFRLLSGCKLRFVTDTPAVGLSGGSVDGMKANGNILIVAYADGSIESFNIASGVPVSNGDKQNSTGFNLGYGWPSGVDISQDGRWAIFGDAARGVGTPTVEVSDISAGSLSPTVPYQFSSGRNSNNVLLSPDQSLLYISNNFSGQVTAAFFNKTTGVVSTGCVSAVLKNFKSTWYFGEGMANATPEGTGNVLYVAEYGFVSSIGIVKISSNGTSCTLTEAGSSPATDTQSLNLQSIGVFPPRNFD
jgi:6-phosphogluconolactonase (cycloisomerase 2 family)